MTIRALAWKDFDDILSVYYALYDEVQQNPDLGITLMPTKPTLGEEIEWFAHRLRRSVEGQCISLVAEVDGRAVGLCTIDHRGPSQELAHIGVLGIMVGAAHRNRGHGRAMIQAALAAAVGRYDQVELSVFASNAPARALYRSLGFRPWGLQPRGVRRAGRYTDVEHMALELPTSTPG